MFTSGSPMLLLFMVLHMQLLSILIFTMEMDLKLSLGRITRKPFVFQRMRRAQRRLQLDISVFTIPTRTLARWGMRKKSGMQVCALRMLTDRVFGMYIFSLGGVSLSFGTSTNPNI